jgi:hypothetical protein
MSASQSKPSPAIGLDIGTSRIVAAKRTPSGEEFRSQLNAFVQIPFSPMTEKALAREGIPYTRKDSLLVVHGNESERFADLLGLEVRRPMTAGMLNPAESDAVEVIVRIVDSLLGPPGGAGETLVYSVPAPPLEGEANLAYHEAALREMLAGRGYRAQSINEGLAVVYAELDSTNYSGIGISCGGGLCNVCLAYLAVPVVSFSIPKAGDFIDSSAAAVTGERATRIRIEKETAFHFNGSFSNKLHQALGVYYDQMVQSLVEAMKEAFSRARNLPRFRQPLPIVLSGGTALPNGFSKRFEEVLRASGFPVPFSEVRMAPEPLNSTAKGALAAALSEA